MVVLLIGMGLRQISRGPSPAPPPVSDPTPLTPEPPSFDPIRPEPSRFSRNTHRPSHPEGTTSGSIDPTLFSAGRDLVYVDDARIFWESDHDKNDTECDHSIHHAMETPFRLLIELVDRAGGTLEVQDAYRAGGNIHNSRSLHKEGRAIDVTCDELGLEKLAKLCWAAGFDWVYYEDSGGGPHVHCSVKRDHTQPE